MITYGIIEDQKPISDALKQSIERLRPNYSCLFTAITIRDTIEYIESYGNPDLLFVDVELEDGICFDLFKSVEITSAIIFTTAFADKVFEAFHMRQSIDYLVKPYDDVDLYAAITKFEQICLDNRNTSPRPNQISVIADELLTRMKCISESRSRRILTVAGDRYESIGISEIGWIVSKDKYVMIMTKRGKELFTTFSSLNEAEEVLPRESFFRANRKYILNIDNIISVNKSFGGKLSVRIGTNSIQEKLIVPFAKKAHFLSWYGAGKF